MTFTIGHTINIGRKKSRKTIEKWKISRRGYKHSAQTIKKLKESHKGQTPWNKGKKGLYTPSIETREKMSKARKGSNHYNWKGGKTKHVAGYVLIHAPHHPNSMKNGYILEHRLIMSKILNRLLDKYERVHHINGIKNDNRKKNLMLFKNESTHMRHHHPNGFRKK